MRRYLAVSAFAILFGIIAQSQAPQTLTVPADSPRWDLQGDVKVVDYQGRKCIRFEGGEADVKDLALRDGVIDVDVSTPAARGFFGIIFRGDGKNGEWVYL